MKFQILIDILFELLSKRKVTATYLAEKHDISVRSVYRYVDDLSINVPIFVQRGRNGGICICDNYKLPRGFMTTGEYEATVEALETMYAQIPEERFLQAKHKITAQMKTESRDLTLSGDLGSIIVDSGTWGDTEKFSEKLKLMEECIREKAVVEMDYQSRLGELSHRKIEPHALVFKQNVWYVYAFCRSKIEFRLFHLGRIRSTLLTGEKFNKRPFTREDIPLTFWSKETDSVEVSLSFSDSAVYLAQDWLGVENLKRKNDVWTADVFLPNDEVLVQKLLAFGDGVKVLAPERLRKTLAETAENIAKQYR